MGYSPWGRKETGTTEQLTLGSGKAWLPASSSKIHFLRSIGISCLDNFGDSGISHRAGLCGKNALLRSP